MNPSRVGSNTPKKYDAESWSVQKIKISKGNLAFAPHRSLTSMLALFIVIILLLDKAHSYILA